MAERALVLGVGNILFSDEGIGVRTVERLQRYAALPDNVVLMDGGTLGIRLMDAIMDCDVLVVYCELAGHRPEAVVIGMEPADYRTMDTALTPVCAARLPQLAEKVLEELRARGVLG